MKNKEIDFDDVDFYEEQNLSDHLFNYGWIKVNKEDWNKFVDFLHDNGVDQWANSTLIDYHGFDTSLDGVIRDYIGDLDYYGYDDVDEDEIHRAEEEWDADYDKAYDSVDYVYIKLYQNENHGKIKEGDRQIMYFFDQIQDDRKYKMDNTIEFISESINSSSYKMKHIVDDLLRKEVGGRDYFNAIDSSVKLSKNLDLVQDVFDRIYKTDGNFNLILTGGFGDWILSMIKKGKLTVPKNLVLVNGSIRGTGNKLNKFTTGKSVDVIFKRDEIDNQKFIMFDDSYYSGSTERAIKKFLKKYNSTVIKTFVLYDGNDKLSKDRESLYRYYNYFDGTEVPVEKLLDYLHDNMDGLPTDELENKISKGQIKSIRQINKELNKLRSIFNKEKIDINNVSRREEIKYENKLLRYEAFKKV